MRPKKHFIIDQNQFIQINPQIKEANLIKTWWINSNYDKLLF
jgi:hypothetical protein